MRAHLGRPRRLLDKSPRASMAESCGPIDHSCIRLYPPHAVGPMTFRPEDFLASYTLLRQVSATALIYVAGLVGLLWALSQFYLISRIPIESMSGNGESERLTSSGADPEKTERLVEIYTAIYQGAESFLRAEYNVCFWFVLVFAILILVLVSWGTGWDMAQGSMTAVSFLLGAFTSMGSGYLGMKVAVYSNVRTTVSAQKPGWTHCFNTAFRAGAVMGFALCAAGLLMLYSTMLLFRLHYPDPSQWILLTEAITGYGLGGSVIAMFGRVGGGIYTKAADVGADLVGKVVHGIPEDDPRNPATIADNGEWEFKVLWTLCTKNRY